MVLLIAPKERRNGFPEDSGSRKKATCIACDRETVAIGARWEGLQQEQATAIFERLRRRERTDFQTGCRLFASKEAERRR